MSKEVEIMEQIGQTQECLRHKEDHKRSLEQELATVNQSIMHDIQTLGELQEKLDHAIHSESVRSTEGDDESRRHDRD